MKTKKRYESPVVEAMEAKVEKGFVLSNQMPIIPEGEHGTQPVVNNGIQRWN